MSEDAAYQAHRIKNIRALGNHIIVSDMQFNERITQSGIVLLNDDMKSAGIRPRWAKVYAVGPDQTDVKIGQYILVSHGRWTRGINIEDDDGEKTIRKVDNDEILMVSDVPVLDQTMSDKVY